MKTIITTVGTSIYSNLTKKEVFEEFNSEKTPILTSEQLDNLSKKELVAEKYSEAIFGQYEENIFNEWVQNIYFNKDEGIWVFKNGEKNKNCCAEIKTLNKIDNFKNSYHLLIATDTAISYSAAKIIRKVLTEIYEVNEKNVKIEIISGLQIHNLIEFQEKGIDNLIEIIKKNSTDAILNISGGYKAIIPILTIIAQLENITLNYIYEESDELIEIPTMSIEFDFSLVEDNYLAFESIKPNKSFKNLPSKDNFLELLINKKDFDILSKYRIIDEVNDKISLTLFGKLLFNKYEELYNKNELARQKLLGEVIEYKLYEYFLGKEEKAKVRKGKNLGKEDFDIDIYIERENQIEAIEVKPGGNIPINKKKDNNSIEYRLTEGSFKYIVDNIEKEKYIFHLIAYFHQDIHNVVKEKIQRLFKEQNFSNKNVVLKFSLLRVPVNYKKNVNWKVDENMIIKKIEIKKQ